MAEFKYQFKAVKENQYTYGVVTTTEDGREIFLHAYNGSSGPVISEKRVFGLQP